MVHAVVIWCSQCREYVPGSKLCEHIAPIVRAAENDALERAAIVLHDCFGDNVADVVRRLKDRRLYT